VPPHSVEAEEQLLSACLLDGGDVLNRTTAAGIEPMSFYVPANRILFEAMLGLHADEKPIDLATIAEALKDSRQLDELGGYAYLTRISSRIPTTANTSFFIERVLELSQLRESIRHATQIVEDCYGYSGDGVGAHLGRTIERLTECIQGRAPARNWRDVVAEAKALTKARMLPAEARSAEAQAMLISWAWGNIDHEFQPIERGELVVVAAYTSTYKSTFARQQGLHSAQHGRAVLVSSFEVSDTELAVNLAANLTGIRSRREIDRLHEREKAELLAGFDDLATLTHFAVCHSDEWLDDIVGRARAFKRRHQLDLWIIDYLQLVADCQRIERGQTEALAIARVTSALKRFATREGCAIILVAQINRAADKDSNREPRLSDLHGSSAIEKDASRVIFLHRPDEIPADKTGTGMIERQTATDDRAWHFIRVIQAKGRNVGTGVCILRADRATATLRRLETSQQAAKAAA
jgi:replicative DNA helicase